MKVQRFFAHTMQDVLRMVRDELGPEAVILSNSKVQDGIEVVATTEYEEPIEVESMSASHDDMVQRPSASEIARLQAEKSLYLQDELDRAKQRIQALQSGQSADESVTDGFADLGVVRDTKRFASDQQATRPSQRRAHDNDIYVDEPQPAYLQARAEQENKAALDEVQAELKALKGLISEQVQKPQVLSPKPSMTKVQKAVSERLEDLSFTRNLRKKLVSAVAKASDFDLAWKKIREGLATRIQVDRSDVIDMGGVVALVGPTGSGKTTTIGKLAARYVMKHGADSIGLVTTDRYRIAAQEQLKVYGRILNVPVHVVDDENSLDKVLDELASRKLVLVDTAGLTPSDSAWSDQMNELQLSAHNVQPYLVTPAVDQYQVMQANFKHYEQIGLQGVIVSKLDEAVSLGEVISFLVDSRLTTAYITDGQRVPEDIGQLDKMELLDRAEDLLNSGERWVTVSSSQGGASLRPNFVRSA